MRLKFIPAFTMLTAGAIICIFDIYNKVKLLTSLTRLLIVMLIFYIIGLIARSVIYKTENLKLKAEEEKEETAETAETAGQVESAIMEEVKQEQ